MSVARAIEILRCGAEDHHKREIRRPELAHASGNDLLPHDEARIAIS